MCSLSTISCAPEMGWSASSCITNASAGGQDEQPSAVNNSTSTGERADSEARTTGTIAAPLPSKRASKMIRMVCKTIYRNAANSQEMGRKPRLDTVCVQIDPSDRRATFPSVWSKNRNIHWYPQEPLLDYFEVPQPDQPRICCPGSRRTKVNAGGYRQVWPGGSYAGIILRCWRPIDEPSQIMILKLDGQGALFEQLARALKGQILTGGYEPGSRLPATRTLAAALGVSRNTVLGAYELLCAEQLAVPHPSSGTRVTGLAPKRRSRESPSAIRAQSRYSARTRKLSEIILSGVKAGPRYDLNYSDTLVRPQLYSSWRRKLAAAGNSLWTEVLTSGGFYPLPRRHRRLPAAAARSRLQRNGCADRSGTRASS